MSEPMRAKPQQLSEIVCMLTTPAVFDLERLPDIVLGKIISYLHWKEKEWLQLAIPSLERVMNSPLAWETFENDRNYAVEKLYMYIYFPFLVDHELNVITKYGRFFQSCTIYIHKFISNGDDRENDFSLLRAVTQHCHQLKSLCIMHPADISLSRLKSSFQDYLKPIQEIATARGSKFKLSLNRLFYSTVENIKSGIVCYMKYLNDRDLLRHIVRLDFSHGLIFDGSGMGNQCPPYLVYCLNLQSLKCPVQCVNTKIVAQLSQRKLSDLYLVNDDHTQQIAFQEKLFIDWSKIYRELPADKSKTFSVHYVFKNRSVNNDDIIPNPFTKSLIFDNLSSNISASMLYHIANLYGLTLLNLAFCSNYWEFLMHFADLGRINESFRYVGSKCTRLRSFLSCLSLPSSALVSLVQHSTRLSTVKVFKENIRLATADKPEGVFIHKMATALGTPNWTMMKKGDNIFNVPNANCGLLFANCFIEF